MRIICLFGIGLLAVLWDLYTRRIPNMLIFAGLMTGFAWQWSANGPPGIMTFLGGILLPLAVLGILHYFRMMGAGDLKYFMVTGGFFGAGLCIKCICISFLIAAVISLAVVIKYRILWKRLRFFLNYIREFFSTGIWTPYLTEGTGPEYLHLSVSIFLGSMLTAGGWI